MKVREIISSNNTIFKVLLTLTRARGIKKYEMALLSGPKQIGEVLRDFPDHCSGIIFSDHHETPVVPASLEIPFYRLRSELFRQIDLYDTHQPVLLVRVDPFSRWTDASWPSGCTLCIPFQDPANVGAVIRSAAAFGVSSVVILKEAAHPFLPKAVRVAGSAIFRVSMFEGPSLNSLDVSNVPLLTLSPEGKDVADFRFPHTFCLVPGLEGSGLPDHLSEEATSLSIPMKPKVESLNAALATGIVLYLWRNGLARRRQAGINH
ncbi:MAG: RNA methyltransferase [Deltaproteobacteria bacterium]|nr:RNA methyltransferase [Deltaproteobacteria bacterium]